MEFQNDDLRRFFERIDELPAEERIEELRKAICQCLNIMGRESLLEMRQVIGDRLPDSTELVALIDAQILIRDAREDLDSQA